MVSNSVLVTRRSQLNVVGVGRLLCKLTIHTKLRLRQPSSNPDDAPDNAKDDDNSDRYTENVSCNNASSAHILIIQKVVYVEPLRRVGEVRKSKVQRKNEDQPRDVYPLRGVRSRNDDFEKRKQAVQAMLADVAPGVELLWKPRPFIQNDPVYDRHEERIRDDGRVKQRMKRLQRSRETIEQ